MSKLTQAHQQVIDAFNSIKGEQKEMKEELSKLEISSVKMVEGEGKKVLIVTVPYRQIASYRKIQKQLVTEFEKRLDGAQVVIVAQRRAFPKTPEHGRRYETIRPAGRTLKAVNEALLEDVVYPATIVGKRVHYGISGTQTTKVMIDQHDATVAEPRLSAYALAYNRLTGLKCQFSIAEF